MWVWSLGREDPLVNGMAIHSSIHTWEIPWTEEPAWWSTVRRVTKSQMRLSDQTTEVNACLVLQYKNLPNCFPEWLYHFTFLWVIHEQSSFSASLPTFDVSTNFSPPVHRCVVVSFEFAFSIMAKNIEQLFYVLICYLNILLSEMPFTVLCPLSNIVFIFFCCWSIENSLYILDTGLLFTSRTVV